VHCAEAAARHQGRSTFRGFIPQNAQYRGFIGFYLDIPGVYLEINPNALAIVCTLVSPDMYYLLNWARCPDWTCWSWRYQTLSRSLPVYQRAQLISSSCQNTASFRSLSNRHYRWRWPVPTTAATWKRIAQASQHWVWLPTERNDAIKHNCTCPSEKQRVKHAIKHNCTCPSEKQRVKHTLAARTRKFANVRYVRVVHICIYTYSGHTRGSLKRTHLSLMDGSMIWIGCVDALVQSFDLLPPGHLVNNNFRVLVVDQSDE